MWVYIFYTNKRLGCVFMHFQYSETSITYKYANVPWNTVYTVLPVNVAHIRVYGRE